MIRSGIGRITGRRGAALRAHGTPVTMRWREGIGSPDPVTGAWAEMGPEQSIEIRALVHSVAPGAHSVRLYAEVETGDILIDIDPAVQVDKPGMTFELDGVKYVQKPIGDELAGAMDVVVNGQRTFRALLLRRQT